MTKARVLLVTALLAVAGCSTAPRPVFSEPLPSSSTSPSLLPDAPAESPSPSPVKVSPRATDVPVAKPPVVKDVKYYVARLPKFGIPPKPQPIDVGEGDSAPMWFKVPTSQRVAFLTIDDGVVRSPMALPLIKASGVRVTLFLTLQYVEKHAAYFKELQKAGAVIENHTITHTSLKGQTYEFQKHEICYTADRFKELFGRRPTLFRPPYGDYDAVTLKVARECGQKVVLYWTETVDKGVVRFQTSRHVIEPGHIVLMHFRPAFADDFTAALTRMKQSGVQPALLEDYVEGA